ncbi:hypothetical protein HN437_00865, partial [Candidatus Woesearchaeota archaeon]|nr:hypothetical protein [Candidatus Woesearchaeota archaeon]
LIISSGDETGSFRYRVMGEEDVYYTKGLADLVDQIKDVNVDYLFETPVYTRITKEDKEILEGIRNRLVNDDLEYRV